jgi:hypothetical protein
MPSHPSVPVKKLRDARSRRYITPHTEGKGNMYIGENFDARRVQRFLYKGLGSPNSAEGVIPPARAVQ